ncbi:MAG: hypothetical protein ACFFE8_16270 [Candidatus Heimdallarchaeota archaeon]
MSYWHGVSKLYNWYAWTKEKLKELAEDLIEFLDQTTNEKIRTLILGCGRALETTFIRYGMPIIRAVDPQIPRMRPHADVPKFPFSLERLETQETNAFYKPTWINPG